MRLLFARDVAEQRDMSVSRARAWLALLEARHGSDVVGRAGNRLFTTEEALARVLPGTAREQMGASRRVAALEVRVARLTERGRMLEAAITRLDGRVCELEAGLAKC